MALAWESRQTSKTRQSYPSRRERAVARMPLRCSLIGMIERLIEANNRLRQFSGSRHYAGDLRSPAPWRAT
jgi:hypothetical protein